MIWNVMIKIEKYILYVWNNRQSKSVPNIILAAIMFESLGISFGQ